MIKIIIIEEFLQESGFEKREKYFDWLIRGWGRGQVPPCLVRSAVVLFRINGCLFFGENQIGNGFVDGWFYQGLQIQAGNFS